MKNILLPVITVLLSVGIISMMINHWMEMSEKRTDIETLETLLLPVKEMLPDNSTISFVTDRNDAKDLYYKTQFVMVPKIITWDMKNDTILVIESADKKSLLPDHTETLRTISNSDFPLKLLRKIN